MFGLKKVVILFVGLEIWDISKFIREFFQVVYFLRIYGIFSIVSGKVI